MGEYERGDAPCDFGSIVPSDEVFAATSITERADRAWKEAELNRITLHE